MTRSAAGPHPTLRDDATRSRGPGRVAVPVLVVPVLVAPVLVVHVLVVAVLVFALSSLAGCTREVTGTPAPAPAAPAATSAAPATSTDPESSAAEPSGDGCRVTLAAGRIQMSGGGRVRTVNGAQQFACRTGPLVAVESVDPAGVRFRLDDASVLVAPAATEQVGPYRITVRQVDAPAAQFDVVATG